MANPRRHISGTMKTASTADVFRAARDAAAAAGQHCSHFALMLTGSSDLEARQFVGSSGDALATAALLAANALISQAHVMCDLAAAIALAKRR